MKKGTLYTLALLLLPALFFVGCKKDLTLKKLSSTDSLKTDSATRHGTVSTVINGLYDWIAADNSGNIYALNNNFGTDTIYKIDSLGHRSFFYTPPITMDHDTAVINTMGCLTVDSLGNLYTVAYRGNKPLNVIKITSAGSGAVILNGITPGGGSQVEKIAVNQGNFYFSNNLGVHEITAGGSSSVILNNISIFTVNRDGVLYYPVISGSGQVNLGQLSAFGTKYTFTNITLDDVVDITNDKAGNLYTSETTTNNHAEIHAINYAKTKKVTIISSAFGHVDGPVATAKIGVAFSLVTNSSGSLYFSEITGNPHDIRRISF